MGVLPDHMGQFRVAQRWWWRRRPGHRILPQRLADGTRLELDLGDRTQALAYLTRRYSDELIRQIVGRLPDAGLLFDVGANAGLVTFQVAQRRPDARIVAFEPNPAAVEAWQRNRRLSASRSVTLEATAVGDQVGSVNLDAPATDLGAGLVAPSGRGVEVPATALDAYCASRGIDRIDVVKVDVEGFEPEVLRGARELLAAGAIRSLIVELNDGHFARRGGSRRAIVEWLGDQRMVPCGPLDADDVAFAPAG
jgi:FkbM family methyltransferase